MAFPTTAEFAPLISSVADAHGLDLENVKATKAGRKSVVQIKVDADDRPALDDLEVVSNEIGAAFDEAEAAGDLNFGAGYTLELSTPGVDLPLTLPRHWRRNRHRLVKIAGQPARIGALNDEETRVIVVRREKKELVVDELTLSETPSAVVDIEFKEPPAQELALTGLSYKEAIDFREEHK